MSRDLLDTIIVILGFAVHLLIGILNYLDTNNYHFLSFDNKITIKTTVTYLLLLNCFLFHLVKLCNAHQVVRNHFSADCAHHYKKKLL